MKQQLPGDITIKTASLFVHQGIVNVVELIRMMSIFESILTPGIIAEITIDDTRNLLSNLPILGGERITIEISSPSKDTRTFELVVASVKESIPSSNMRSKNYTLQCVTPEVLTAKSCQITKSYNTNISNMVEDVCKTYLQTDKKLDIQKTKGVQKIIIASKPPLEAIKRMRKQSISVDDKSSMFVFFENIDGIHYKTIESLFSGDISDRTFTNNPTMHTDMTQSNFRNIIDYKQDQQFDLTKRLHNGGLAHEIKSFDFKTLSYKSAITKFAPAILKAADGVMNNPDNDQTIKRWGSNAGSNSWVMKDSGNPDTFISDGLGTRQNTISLMGQGFLHLHVLGDSGLSAGQMIKVDLLDTTSTDSAPSLHPQLSGKYLVAFIRHIIMPEGSSPRYTCSIEALKGGYKQNV